MFRDWIYIQAHYWFRWKLFNGTFSDTFSTSFSKFHKDRRLKIWLRVLKTLMKTKAPWIHCFRHCLSNFDLIWGGKNVSSVELPCCKNDGTALVTANAIVKLDIPWISSLHETRGRSFSAVSPEVSTSVRIF